jgi:disulfide bond formation protein DsbB
MNTLPEPATDRAGPAYLAALVLAVAGSVASVWLSVGLGLKACPLCFYQRAGALLAGTTLLLGLTSPALLPRAAAALLALPAAVLGLGVAAFHVWLEQNGTLECPKGMFDLGTAPQQSLALFVLLTPAVLIAAWRDPRVSRGTIALAVLLGGAAAWASVKSAPPLPPVPKAAYPDALVMCRPPFKP